MIAAGKMMNVQATSSVFFWFEFCCEDSLNTIRMIKHAVQLNIAVSVFSTASFKPMAIDTFKDPMAYFTRVGLLSGFPPTLCDCLDTNRKTQSSMFAQSNYVVFEAAECD